MIPEQNQIKNHIFIGIYNGNVNFGHWFSLIFLYPSTNLMNSEQSQIKIHIFIANTDENVNFGFTWPPQKMWIIFWF